MSDTLAAGGWRHYRFDEMASMINDRVDNPSDANVDYYVGLEHLDSDSLAIRRWGSPTDVEATKLRFRAGDIIFGRRRVYQRKLGLAHFDGICSAHAMVLRARPDVALPGFLPFFMQSEPFMERAKEISVGSLSPTINWKTLAKERFALPPLEEQRKTVEVLSTLETQIAATTRLSHSLYVLLRACARDLFTEDLRSTNVVFAQMVQDWAYGPRFSSELYSRDGKLAQLRTTDITDDGEIVYDTIPRAALNPSDYASHLLRDGDLVMSRSGTCGITAIFKDDGPPTIAAAFLFRIRPKPSVNSAYLHEFFSSAPGRQLTASLARGGVQKNIKGSQLLKQRVPFPTAERQSYVASRMSEIRGSIRRNAARQFELRALKRALLRKATDAGS